jgi:nucleotide-binding universal stress UspA family protein
MLPEVVPAEFRDKVSIEIIAKGGEVRSELRGIVEDKEIDLVVMGTHGRNYLERLVLGSVTERMLRQLPVPVMTVSHLDPAKEMPAPGIVPIRRILYATDLSEGSEPGLQFAIRFARGLDARLTVVHVLENLEHMFVGADMAAYMPSYEGNVREMTREKLNRVVALHSDGSVPITTVLENGIPYQAINRVAAEINADLIVMNLHGKGRLERALLGSTAERVIRTATIPVLSLPLPGVYVPRWVAA